MYMYKEKILVRFKGVFMILITIIVFLALWLGGRMIMFLEKRV